MAVSRSRPNFFKAVRSRVLSFLKKEAKNLIPPAIALAIFLVVWQILVSNPQATLPGPWQILTDKNIQKLILNPFFITGEDKGLGWQTWASLQRVMIGYSLAAVTGIGIGIFIGANKLMYRSLDPLFQVLRTVPPLAWLPIALAVFQKAESAGIFVIFITAIWPIIFNTAVGVQQMPQDYKNVARVLRLSGQKYFWKILLPSIVPYMFTGLRIGIGLAWLAIVAAEMLRGDTGIGFFIWNSYNSSNNSEVILALLYIGVVGLLLDRLVGFISTLVIAEEQKQN